MRPRNVCVAVASIYAAFVFVLPCALASAQDVQLTKEFAQELSRSGLVLDTAVFRDFTVVRVLPNPDFAYSFAVRHRTLPLEVRFATRELPPAGSLRPDAWRDGYAETSMMNMARQERSGPMMSPLKQYDKNAVRKEFNADWGVTAAFTPSPTFSKYESGNAVVIYQEKRRSFGYIIYLYNGDFSGPLKSAFAQVFYAVHFK